MSKIISGTDLAKKHEYLLKEKIIGLSKKPKIVSILIGDDPSSLLYTQMKQKKASSLGIGFDYMNFSETESFHNVVMTIIKLNNDPEISGIMVQLPLPKKFLQNNTTEDLLKNINLQKDVDGLTPNSPFLPATVKAVMSIIHTIPSITNNKLFAVLGSEGQVGKALVKELKKQNFLVTEIDIKNSDFDFQNTKKADVVISCVGKDGIIKSDDIKENAILIDVGLGDFDKSCFDKAALYTPKIGGVGPVTVISLMENSVDSILLHNES